MKKNNLVTLATRPSDPKIAGAGILSCISGISLLGQSGKVLSRQLGLDTINPEKKYSYKIRSKIIEQVKLAYGDVGVYALSLGMTDGFKLPVMSRLDRAKRKLEREISQKKISLDDGLGKFLKEYISFINATSKTVINWHEENRGAWLEKIGNYNYKITYNILFEYSHLAFVKGSHTELLMRYISNLMDFEFIFLEDESRPLKHGSKFVFQVRFTRKIKKIDSYALAEKHKHEVTKNFLKVVLKASDDKKNIIQGMSNKLSKFIPPQMHQAMVKGEYDTEIITKRKKLTIFFSDIVNFTSISELLQPEDLTRFLNQYFSEMTSIALDYGATIDKYIGDAIMLFFGDPDTKGEREDARACVDMALAMQSKMVDLRDNWREEGFADPFQVRMGINTGYCSVGNFGSEQRLTYTVIGAEVNVAQRLEANADPNRILLSYETYVHVEDMVEVDDKESIRMKGIGRDIRVFSVLDKKNDNFYKKLDKENKSTKTKLSKINLLEKDIAIIKKDLGELKNQVNVILNKL